LPVSITIRPLYRIGHWSLRAHTFLNMCIEISRNTHSFLTVRGLVKSSLFQTMVHCISCLKNNPHFQHCTTVGGSIHLWRQYKLHIACAHFREMDCVIVQKHESMQ
jgi:hypothetical protein